MATAPIQTVETDTRPERHEPSTAELWAIVREQRAEIDRLARLVGAQPDETAIIRESARESRTATESRRLHIGMPRAPRFAVSLGLALAVVCGGSAALASTNGSRFDHGCYTAVAAHATAGVAGACPADALSGK